MFFSYRKNYSLNNLKFGTSSISSTDSTKFLGIEIDKHLTFRPHVSNIAGKISRAVGILYRLNTILPVKTLKTLYSRDWLKGGTNGTRGMQGMKISKLPRNAKTKRWNVKFKEWLAK